VGYTKIPANSCRAADHDSAGYPSSLAHRARLEEQTSLMRNPLRTKRCRLPPNEALYTRTPPVAQAICRWREWFVFHSDLQNRDPSKDVHCQRR